MDVVSFHIARPFSANRMYSRQTTKRGHRNLTQEYKAWCAEMGWALKIETSDVPQVTCRFDVTIELPPTRMDTDNTTKPILDLAQRIGLITNDRNVNKITTDRTDDREDVLVVLTMRNDLTARAPVKRRKAGAGWGKPKPAAGLLAAYRRAGVAV